MANRISPAAGRRMADAITAIARQYAIETAAFLERMEAARARREAPAFAARMLPLVEGRRPRPAYAPLHGGRSEFHSATDAGRVLSAQ